MRAAAMTMFAALLLAATACSGSNGASTPTGTSGVATAPPATSSASGLATATAGSPAPATPVPAGTPLAAADATRLLDAALLKAADLPPADGWKVSSDTTADNAQAATADPTSATSNQRCHRLLGRTVTLQPADITGAYLGGKTVTFFATATVYETATGAADCAAEAAVRYQQPGELAKAFGPVFTDPASVVVTPVEFPGVGDGSFAVTLAGRTNANGLVVDLTILAVGFREGAVTAVVGSAAMASPPTDELKPLVALVDGRIADAQK